MVSRAIAAVDAWLESAERLLKEQRDQGISPGNTAAWDSRVEESTLWSPLSRRASRGYSTLSAHGLDVGS